MRQDDWRNVTEPDFQRKFGGSGGEKPHFEGFFVIFSKTASMILMKFCVSIVLSNTYHLVKTTCSRFFWFRLYSRGQNPFFESFFRLFLCDTTLWQSDAEFPTTWNLDRMYSRYSYLKTKKIFNFYVFIILKKNFP